jgi:RNA polymerase sigma-70 factor (ECF subfamily)
LLLLSESRRPARVAADGSLVRLADQDRTLWDAALIAEGQGLVRECLRRATPGPYQVQAAIAAVHSDAPRVEDTDWASIVTLYDQLLALAPSDVVRLNRAVAIAELLGPSVALAETDALQSLHDYHLWHATRAELLERLGRGDEAAQAFALAAAATANEAERNYLQGRRDALVG